MTTAAYTYDELPFKRSFYYSVFLHLALATLTLISIWVQRSGNAWGGVGGGSDSGVKVNLVPSAGIPMPPNINPTESQTFDPTKGLNVELPKPKPPEPPTDATKIPKFEKEKPLPPSKKSRVFEPKTPPPDNAVNYGKGGSPSIPSSYSNTPGPLNGGVAVQGQGGGDFAARYAWYVEAVRRNINQNWMQNTIDPAVRAARHAKATVTFTINRDGSIKNIRITESSGNRSMDDSAQRALLSVDHFPALPSDYSGRYVDVTFDFDLSLTR